MQIIRSQVRNTLLFLLVCALFVIFVAVFIGFSSKRSVMPEHSDTVNQEAMVVSEVAELNVKLRYQNEGHLNKGHQSTAAE